jgi:hypothetical protein
MLSSDHNGNHFTYFTQLSLTLISSDLYAASIDCITSAMNQSTPNESDRIAEVNRDGRPNNGAYNIGNEHRPIGDIITDNQRAQVMFTVGRTARAVESALTARRIDANRLRPVDSTRETMSREQLHSRLIFVIDQLGVTSSYHHALRTLHRILMSLPLDAIVQPPTFPVWVTEHIRNPTVFVPDSQFVRAVIHELDILQRTTGPTLQYRYLLNTNRLVNTREPGSDTRSPILDC